MTLSRIIVKTLDGDINLDVTGDLTVKALRTRLHASQGQPMPDDQNLILRGKALTEGDATLSSLGIHKGGTLVAIKTGSSAFRSSSPPPNRAAPLPSAADIRAAIVEESRRRGVEPPPPAPSARAPHHLGLGGLISGHPTLASLFSAAEGMAGEVAAAARVEGAEQDNHLLGLIEALEGRLGLLRQAQAQQGDAAAAAEMEAEAMMTMGAGGGGGGPPPAASAPPSAQAPRGPPPVIQPPEPNADSLAQIMDMGFSEAVARKALLLQRNRLPESIEWLLMHGDDEDAAEPVTQEQLRQVYGPGPSGHPIANNRGLLTTAFGGGGGGGGGGAGGGGPGEGAAGGNAAAAASALMRELQMSLFDVMGAIGGDNEDGMDGDDGDPIAAVFRSGWAPGAMAGGGATGEGGARSAAASAAPAAAAATAPADVPGEGGDAEGGEDADMAEAGPREDDHHNEDYHDEDDQELEDYLGGEFDEHGGGADGEGGEGAHADGNHPQDQEGDEDF